MIKTNKKILSLLVVLTMIIGSMSISIAALTDIVGAPVEPAVLRLEGLGVLTGYPDGTFRPNEKITRAEYAAVVYRATRLTQIPGNTVFGDVPASHWASSYIKAATQAGLIKGRGLVQGVNTFDPEANISYDEAVTLVVRALGYETLAQSSGGYPTGYLVVANQKGLLQGISGNLSMPATRALVAQLTFNALEIKKDDGMYLFNELHMINAAAKSGNWSGISLMTFADAGITGVNADNLENLKLTFEALANGVDQKWLPTQISAVATSRGPLAIAISEADELEEADYTPASWTLANLAAAIPAAEAVLLNSTANQAQINAAKSALDLAVGKLVSTVPLTDLQIAEAAVVVAEGSGYQTDINDAQALVSALPSGAARVALQLRLDAIIVVLDMGVRAAEGITTTEGVDFALAVPGVKGFVTVDTDILLTAANTLTDGSEISITITQQSGINDPLIVDLSGKEIQVGLATNALGNPKTTRAQVVSAINAHSGASALVDATGGSSTLAAPVANTPLAGGTATVVAATATKVVYEVEITSGAHTTGNITINGVGAPETVAVVSGMTPALVAQEIATDAGLIVKATAAGYVMTAVGNRVVFTALSAGAIGGTGPAGPALVVTVQ
jgi:hypothetical protein